MNLLYFGGYKSRFKLLFKYIIQSKSVLEICFGDIIIADFCRKNNILWTGYDINESFVNYAKIRGYNAVQSDVKEVEVLPVNDLCIISGSLYHFAEKTDLFFIKILNSSKRIIISEPVKNLSDNRGLIGFIAKHSANSGKGYKKFRYTEKTIIEMIEQQKIKHRFDYKILYKFRKDLIIEITK